MVDLSQFGIRDVWVGVMGIILMCRGSKITEVTKEGLFEGRGVVIDGRESK